MLPSVFAGARTHYLLTQLGSQCLWAFVSLVPNLGNLPWSRARATNTHGGVWGWLLPLPASRTWRISTFLDSWSLFPRRELSLMKDREWSCLGRGQESDLGEGVEEARPTPLWAMFKPVLCYSHKELRRLPPFLSSSVLPPGRDIGPSPWLLSFH